MVQKEEDKEKYEETETNFEGAYLSDGLADSAQKLKWEVPHSEGVSTAKMVNFCPAIMKLRMCEKGIFLVPVKYTLVCRAPTLAVLGRTTHYRVS